MSDPQTTLHYAPGSNLVGTTYAPGADGFNLADVSSVAQVNALPTGVEALVYLGYTGGDTATFQSMIAPYIDNSKVYGFYLADEPGPGLASELKAESDYIHSVDPGAMTFIVLENNGTPTSVSYSYNPANTDIDLFGLDPYPIRPEFTGGANYAVIGDAVTAAEAEGIPQSKIVPVYQAFGATSGAYDSWSTPTAAQEQTILSTWGQYVPSPAFDYAYSWGVQEGDTAISVDPSLQQVFAAHNASSATAPAPTPAAALSVGNASATAGNAEIFTVTLSQASAETVTVGYATHDGTAVAGTEYTAASGTLTFAAGQTQETVSVATLDNDPADQASETFTLALSNPTNATLGTATGTATIIEDNNPPPTATTHQIAITRPHEVVSGTGGGDVFVFSSLADARATITNFNPASDELDLRQLMTAIGYHGTDPVADKVISFVAHGAHATELVIDAPGSNQAVDLVTLQHVLPSAITPQDYAWH